MKRHLLTVATLLALTTLGGTAFAADPAPAAGAQKTRLDTNGDGVIDKTEAAASPRLAAAFAKLDANGDGKLDRSELKHGRGKGDRRGHRGGIEQLDTDKDGRISRAEFAAGEAQRAERAAKAGRPVDANAPKRPDFAALDANKDGYLTRAELKAFHERQKPQREAEHRARFDAAYKALDTNNDGRLSKVEVAAQPKLAERFAWLDDNRDGFLSKAEVEGELRGPRGGGERGPGPHPAR